MNFPNAFDGLDGLGVEVGVGYIVAYNMSEKVAYGVIEKITKTRRSCYPGNFAEGPVYTGYCLDNDNSLQGKISKMLDTKNSLVITEGVI